MLQASPGRGGKRKKWTEEEERSLIDKYAEMQADGAISRMKTRESKFRPIAAHVNARHHAVDPAAFPFQWSWKDASTKVQNMRHQYLLVKQKLLSGGADPPPEDGLSLWPNFLRYRQVFGDLPLPSSELGLGLGFPQDEDGSDFQPLPRKKRRKRADSRAWAAVEAQIARLKETEARLEQREAELASDRKRTDEIRRREINAWEERAERRRHEWKKTVDGLLDQHRLEMDQIQARVAHVQQSMVAQILTLASHWPVPGQTPPAAMDSAAAAFPGHHHHHHHHHHPHHQVYVSQMMQNLHHLNGIVHGDARVDGESQDDQFIVDDG